jgi:hypothetical protein
VDILRIFFGCGVVTSTMFWILLQCVGLMSGKLHRQAFDDASPARERACVLMAHSCLSFVRNSPSTHQTLVTKEQIENHPSQHLIWASQGLSEAFGWHS